MKIEIKTIKIILILGNVLCVNKNFCLFGKLMKAIITIRVIIELFLPIYDLVSSYINSSLEENATQIVLSYLFSIICIVMSCYYSVPYVKLIRHLNANHIRFKKYDHYSSRLRKYLRTTIFVWITQGAIVLTLTGHHFSTHYRNFSTNDTLPGLTVLDTLLQISGVCSSFRFSFEYVSLFCILSTMSEQMQCIINSICYVEHSVMSNVAANFGLKEMRKLDQWLKAYARVKESSKIINKVYGVQIMAVHLFSVVYYVTYYYKAVSVKLLGYLTGWTFIFFLFGMNFTLLTKGLAVYEAQSLENGYDTMKRRLNQLLLRLQKNDTNYKAVKNFLRLASTQPIATKTFGNVRVNMKLIPAYLAIITSYTVVALQFNNVL